MKIVIDISNYDAEWINNADCIPDTLNYKIADAIIDGTPLPERYGRLGDLDALEKEMINGIKAGINADSDDNHSCIINVDDCVDRVRCADTIIEANKGPKNE